MISDIIPQEERKKKINQFISINSKKNNHKSKSKLVTRYMEDQNTSLTAGTVISTCKKSGMPREKKSAEMNKENFWLLQYSSYIQRADKLHNVYYMQISDKQTAIRYSIKHTETLVGLSDVQAAFKAAFSCSA